MEQTQATHSMSIAKWLLCDTTKFELDCYAVLDNWNIQPILYKAVLIWKLFY